MQPCVRVGFRSAKSFTYQIQTVAIRHWRWNSTYYTPTSRHILSSQGFLSFRGASLRMCLLTEPILLLASMQSVEGGIILRHQHQRPPWKHACFQHVSVWTPKRTPRPRSRLSGEECHRIGPGYWLVQFVSPFAEINSQDGFEGQHTSCWAQ